MAKAVLVDITKCIGCGSCSVACKLWNDLEFDDSRPTVGVEAQLNDVNWTAVQRHDVQSKDSPQALWRFVKQQCLHCLEPACASACFSKALQRNDSGAVVYYPDLCVGCRYCMIACPFNIPKYEWKKTFPLVTKCQMCSTKTASGEAPACVSVCPTMALKYGERSALLKEARQLVNTNHLYIKEIYGEYEVGGTSWLYISDVPFEQLGFKTDVGTKPLPSYTHNFLKYTPFLAIGWGMFLTGLSFYTKRRNKITSQKQADDDNKETTSRKSESTEETNNENL
ncbi:MAG: 4Fe-4S dicluster domain-containing protein [Negativicutes bacterium]|nr:4Fe-4S dicluster domain-containing protein [Negativicutes bacterium]